MKCIKIRLLLSVLLLAIFAVSCSEDSVEPPTPSPPQEATIWNGPTVTFQKPNDSNPGIAANQDRITDEVWLTRGNDGGQIYNAVSESSANKDDSPAGTLWAIGTTADFENLSFAKFRTTVGKPKNVVGTDLVLLLVEENIAIDIKFTSWAQNKGGGFSYERSSN